MCRNIKVLYHFDPPVTADEITAAATQYVRKITGYNKPSQANEAAFKEAIHRISHVTHDLMTQLTTDAPHRDREIERQKAQERSLNRFGTS